MSLIAELRRRNVFRVGAAYAIVAWLLVEVASVFLPALHLPDWTLTFLVFLVILGFPLTLVIAWAFELTPEGIKPAKDVAPAESIRHLMGRKLDFIIIGLLAVAVVSFAVDKFVLEAESEQASVAQVKSIAVLPFANMSGDPQQEFLSDGISEELLNVLAKVKGLRVTSRTSAFAFKGTNTSIPEIAEKLHVQHVLEGSVRMAGDRVRITTQLIEVETDSHLWSASYDRELSDIFAVQDEIAAQVGEALKVALLGTDSTPIRSSLEISVDAYSDYLLARQKLANMSVASARESERLLKSVIEREPDYAPAYSALAETYARMSDYGSLSSSEASVRMMPLIEQALAIDDRLAGAWQHLAYVRRVNNDFEGARAAEKRALELDPQNPLVLRGQIAHWQWTHEAERGLVYADELLRVDPLSQSSLLRISEFYFRIGLLDEAEKIIERIGLIDPQSSLYLSGASFLAEARGDLVSAMGWLQQYRKSDNRDPEGPSTTAEHYLQLGDVAAAELWNDEALRIDPEAPHARLIAAFLYLNNNEEPEALQIARELTRLGSDSRWGARGIALRILTSADLAAGNDEAIITRYLTHYPELAERKFPVNRLEIERSLVSEAFIVTLDLASGYLRAGERAEAESLLSLVESELPHWPKTSFYGSGSADVELHALRGEKDQALAALRERVARGSFDNWRLQLLYNSNLDSIRDTPEFAGIVTEWEADMAAQLERVREMERDGELEPIPELVAE